MAYDGTGIGGAGNTQNFTQQNGGAALLSVDATTGKITAGTGAIDFENPLDKGFNNQYDFTVTYTDYTAKHLLKQRSPLTTQHLMLALRPHHQKYLHLEDPVSIFLKITSVRLILI